MGKRDGATCREFMADLSDRMIRPPVYCQHSPRISTDGFPSYVTAIAEEFGTTASHGVLIKQYVNPEVGRYAPPKMCGSNRINEFGVDDLSRIVTSHVERANLTIRTFLRRFTRLALGFSKKLDNLKSAVSLFMAYYNMCWRPREKGKSGKLRPTPAVMAGLCDELWSIERLYDEVMQHDHDQKQAVKYRKLLNRLK